MTTAALWRPYEDEPLFVPQMLLGFDALEPADADRLTRYLAALVARRGIVHTIVAFNAVYFGYDLGFGGYVGGPVDFDRFEQVTFGETTAALPVGAMVNVATGSDPLFAEVVYKEGAHPALRDDGDVPGWVSGAPAGARGPDTPPEPQAAPVLTERHVVDFDAFGPGLVATSAKLDRLRRRGKWLDSDGHLLLEARYASAEDAEAADIEFYARYLLTRGREQLLAGPLPLLLTDDAGEDQLAAAVRAALDTVAAVLASIGTLRVWRGYAFPRAALGARLASHGVLGGDDLAALAVAISRPGPVTRRRFAASTGAVRYTAAGPLLRTISGTAPQLAGLGYPAAVCHANAVIGDYARREADDDGVLPSGAHLRLDDGWQGGGVWRASDPPGPYARIDPLIALGLGWIESQQPPAAEPPPQPPAEPEPTPVDDVELPDDLDSGADLTSVTDSHLSWTVTLRLAHTITGVAALPDRVAKELRDGRPSRREASPPAHPRGIRPRPAGCRPGRRRDSGRLAGAPDRRRVAARVLPRDRADLHLAARRGRATGAQHAAGSAGHHRQHRVRAPLRPGCPHPRHRTRLRAARRRRPRPAHAAGSGCCAPCGAPGTSTPTASPCCAATCSPTWCMAATPARQAPPRSSRSSM